MSKEVFREGVLGTGQSYAVFGKALNGEAYHLNDEVSVVGEDTVVVLPEINVIGVFDGAGGTKDLGSPLQAALTAARATAQFFHLGGTELEGAMEYARQAVINDDAASICVGSLLRVAADRSVRAVNAGDTGVVAYDAHRKSADFFSPQQLVHGEPSNFLGRSAMYLHPLETDSSRIYTPERPDETEYYVMSDGVLGNWQGHSGLEDFHFEAAHDDYLLLRTAYETTPHLEEIIRGELDMPDLRLREMTWDEWLEVKPYLEDEITTERRLDVRRFLSTLVERPISWHFARHHQDDATVAVVNYRPLRSR